MGWLPEGVVVKGKCMIILIAMKSSGVNLPFRDRYGLQKRQEMALQAEKK